MEICLRKTYTRNVIPRLDYGVSLWNPYLKQAHRLERVKKKKYAVRLLLNIGESGL